MNQITDFRFVGSMWVGEARKVRGRVFSEKEPTRNLWKMMGFCEKGAGGMLDLEENFPCVSLLQKTPWP